MSCRWPPRGFNLPDIHDNITKLIRDQAAAPTAKDTFAAQRTNVFALTEDNEYVELAFFERRPCPEKTTKPNYLAQVVQELAGRQFFTPSPEFQRLLAAGDHTSYPVVSYARLLTENSVKPEIKKFLEEASIPLTDSLSSHRREPWNYAILRFGGGQGSLPEYMVVLRDLFKNMPNSRLPSYQRAGGCSTDDDLKNAADAIAGAITSGMSSSVLSSTSSVGPSAVDDQTAAICRALIALDLVVGTSEDARKMFEIANMVARADTSVLLTGGTGLGKSTLAKYIHMISHRASGPFETVDCTQQNADLLQADLYGQVKGAYTGAVRDRMGMFMGAAGGTIFLDEIGEMPSDLQPTLLRALNDKEGKRLGSDIVDRYDVRVIAATNRDLGEMVKMRNFREDLYYRIAVVRLEVPSIHKDDVRACANHRLQKKQKLAAGRPRMHPAATGFAKDAYDAMEAYSWPGGYRQLDNVVEAASVQAPGQEISGELMEECIDLSEPKAGQKK